MKSGTNSAADLSGKKGNKLEKNAILTVGRIRLVPFRNPSTKNNSTRIASTAIMAFMAAIGAGEAAKGENGRGGGVGGRRTFLR